MIWCGPDQRPSSCLLISPGRGPECSRFHRHQIREVAMTKERQVWLMGSAAPGQTAGSPVLQHQPWHPGPDRLGSAPGFLICQCWPLRNPGPPTLEKPVKHRESGQESRGLRWVCGSVVCVCVYLWGYALVACLCVYEWYACKHGSCVVHVFVYV